MLSREENQLICEVDAGTPMGEMMRQYWIPALLSSELAEADGAPLRVRLLGEDLIAFRDTSGRVGLLANSCAHRGASLFFGRNEENGLRCVYHGWKYDVSGHCVDMPNEPAESNFKEKIRLGAYLCVERGGLIWTYMGARSVPPALPDFEWNMDDSNPAYFFPYQRECNWLQALEGDIDTAHLNFLHTRLQRSGDERYGLPQSTHPGAVAMSKYNRDPHPRLEVVDTPYGVMYAARRNAEEDSYYWRVSQFLFPFYTMPAGGATAVEGKIWVPLDNQHTLVFEHRWRPEGFAAEELERMSSSRNPNGYAETRSDGLGRWRFAANSSNDFQLDRELMKTALYLGIKGNPGQDGAIQWSMGPIYDRTREHLGTTDTAIVRVRRRLIDAAKALRDTGAVPPGVEDPSLYHHVRNGWSILAKDASWVETHQPA